MMDIVLVVDDECGVIVWIVGGVVVCVMNIVGIDVM